ncbi:MAG: hypothetical protein LUF31_03540 [Fusobacterium sp.]|nr:hypothetical protein [Fusobacterium sp.]
MKQENYNKEMAIMAAVLGEVKENYNLEDAEVIGQSISEKKVVHKLNDKGIKVTVEYTKKTGIEALYAKEIVDKGISGITKGEFEDKINEGCSLSEIVEKCSVGKLPGTVKKGDEVIKPEDNPKKNVDKEKKSKK